MLKSTSVLAAAILATAGFAGAGSAQAASITPASTSFTLSGTLTLSQSTTVNCVVTLNGSTNGTGSAASITSGSFGAGDWQCGWLVTPSNFPWAVTPTGVGTQLKIDGIGAKSILGNCAGTVYVDWDNPPSSGVDFSGQSVDGNPGPCYIEGRLDSSTNLTVTP